MVTQVHELAVPLFSVELSIFTLDKPTADRVTLHECSTLSKSDSAIAKHLELYKSGGVVVMRGNGEIKGFYI